MKQAKPDDFQSARFRFLKSVERLLADADEVKKSRDDLLKLADLQPAEIQREGQANG